VAEHVRQVADLHGAPEAGRPVEADHIVGWMLGRARAQGVDDTILSLAYTHLKTYEARRAASRLPGA
jgi:2-dehydropantoate 2-reductase